MTIEEYALKFVGRPYIWAGDGTGAKKGGFDCSGLVIESLQAFGELPNGDWTADGLRKKLASDGSWEEVPPKAVRAGDILFFGTSAKISHVAIAIDEKRFVEAGGGGSKSTTVENSTGFVRVRPVTWRKDLVVCLRKKDL